MIFALELKSSLKKIGRIGIKKIITRRIKSNSKKGINRIKKQFPKGIMTIRRIFKEEIGGVIIRIETIMLRPGENITRKIK